MRSKSQRDVVRLPRFYSNRYTEEPKGAPSDASHTHSGGKLDKEGSHLGRILTSLGYPHLPLAQAQAQHTQTRCFPSRCCTAAPQSHTLLDESLGLDSCVLQPVKPLEAGVSPCRRHVFQLSSRSPSPNQDRQLPSSVMAARDSCAGWAGEHAVSIGVGCAARTTDAPRCRQRPNRPQADMAPIGEGTEVWGEERRVSDLGFPRTRGQPDGAGPALPNDMLVSSRGQTRRAPWPRAPAHQPLGSLTPTPLNPP